MAEDVGSLVEQLFEIDMQRQIAQEQAANRLVSDAESQMEVVDRTQELAFRNNELNKQVSELDNFSGKAASGILGGDSKRIEVANAVRGLLDSQLQEIQEAEAARNKWEETRNAGMQPMDYVRKLFNGLTSAEMAHRDLNNEVEDVRQVTQNIQNLDAGFASAYNTAKNTAELSDTVLTARERINQAKFNLANDTSRLNTDQTAITISQQLTSGLSELNAAGLDRRQKMVQDIYQAETAAVNRKLLQENRLMTRAQRLESVTNSKVNAVAKAYGEHFSAVDDLGEFAVASGAMDFIPEYKAVSNEFARVSAERTALEVELTVGNLSVAQRADKSAEIEKLRMKEAEVANQLREKQAVMDTKVANAQRAKIEADATLQAKTLDQFNKLMNKVGGNMANSYAQISPILKKDKNLQMLVYNYNDANPSSIIKGRGATEVRTNLHELTKELGGGAAELIAPDVRRFMTGIDKLTADFHRVEAPARGYSVTEAKNILPGYVDQAVERAQLTMLSSDTSIPGVGEHFKMTGEDFLARADASPLAKELGHYLKALNEPASQENIKDFFLSKYWAQVKDVPARDYQARAPKLVSGLAKEMSTLITDITATKTMSLYELGIISNPEFIKPVVATGRLTASGPAPSSKAIYDLSNPNDLVRYLKTDETFMNKLMGTGASLLPSTVDLDEENTNE